ncbi:hypothetical protein, partial [Bradyrhizobium sp.]|uniref:hypothetical protein n=1 Tax=Bradyrhizobium sp. TaxID=376 RepID=UPI00239D30E6
MVAPQRSHQLAATGFSVLLVVLSLIAAELFVRWLDGYRVFSVRRSADQSQTIISADPFVARLPVADGMNRDWFKLSPPHVPDNARVLPNMAPVVARYNPAGLSSEVWHVFSRGFVDPLFCVQGGLSTVGSVFLFDTPDGGRYPRYRFPLNAVLMTSLHTNQFGWRGPPIELAKPPNTIRLAFVGASTTVNNHGFPFSYPELTVFWLEQWAKALKLDVKFEVINAGREGIISTDIAAVVRDEVLPLEPDLVVYYEGSNQFRAGSIEKFPNGVVPEYRDPGRASRIKQYLAGGAGTAASYSAILSRIVDALGDVGDIAEPRKPDYEVVWPKDVNEFDPPLDHPDLPSNLTTILHDIDDIRTHVA